MGALDFLRAAIPGAIAARTGYLQGQEQEQDKQKAERRQSALDMLKRAVDEANVRESDARAEYYRNGGSGGGSADNVQWVRDGNGNYVPLPKKIPKNAPTDGTTSGGTETTSPSVSGSAGPKGPLATLKSTIDPNDGGRGGDAVEGANAAAESTPSDAAAPKPPTFALGKPSGVTAPAPKPPAAPRPSKIGELDPSTGNINDVLPDGTRRFVRKATAAEIEKAARVPGSGASGAKHPMNPKTRESYLQGIADRAVEASGGDVRKAAAAASQDPDGLEAFNNGLATRHFDAAKQRYDRQHAIDIDVHPTMDPSASAPPPAKAKPAGVISRIRTAMSSAPSSNTAAPRTTAAPAPKSPTSGDINLGDGETSIAPTAAAPKTDTEKAAEVVRRIEASSGRITPQQALKSSALNSSVKAMIRKRYGLPE